MKAQLKIDQRNEEYEICFDDIKTICDEVGCNAEQIVGILLELNIISIRQHFQTVHFKGKALDRNKISNLLFSCHRTFNFE